MLIKYEFIFDIIFLPIIIFIGLITSYQDFRHGSIKNKWIILGLIWGGGWLILFFFWDLIIFGLEFFGFKLSITTFSLKYLGQVFLNSIAAVLVAFFLWRQKGWAAGDAKLFIVYSLLLPLKYYSKTFLPLFPSFVLLVNIFIPPMIFILLQSIINFFNSLLKDRVEQPLKKNLRAIWLAIKQIGLTSSGFIFVFIIIRLIRQSSFGSEIEKLLSPLLGQNSWIILLFFLFIYKPISNFLSRHKSIFIVLVIISVGYFIFLIGLSGLTIASNEIKGLISLPLGLASAGLLLQRFLKIEQQKKISPNIPFAVWVFLGVIITLLNSGLIWGVFGK